MNRLLLLAALASVVPVLSAPSLTPISIRAPGLTAATTASGLSGAGEFGGDSHIVLFLSDAPNLLGPPSKSGVIELYRQDLASGIRQRLSRPSPDGGGTGNVQSFSVSADGARIVFTRLATKPGGFAREDVFLSEPGAVAPRWIRLGPLELTEPPGIHTSAALSGDGKWLVFDCVSPQIANAPDSNVAPDVFRRNLETGETELLSQTPGGAAGNRGSSVPLVGHDGSTVVFLSEATDLVPLAGMGTALIVWRPGGPLQRVVLPGTPSTPLTAPLLPEDMVLSPDGRFLSFSITNPRLPESLGVWWCDLESNRVLRASGAATIAGEPVSMSADGRTLAFTVTLGTAPAITHQVRIWSESTGLRTLDELRVTVPPVGTEPESSSAPILSSDATQLVFTSPAAIPEAGVPEPGLDRLYHRVLSSGKTRLLSHDAAFPGASFSPDGSRLVFQMQEPVLTPGDNNGTFDVVTVRLPEFEQHLVSTAASDIAQRTATGPSQSAIGFSDDGRLAVFSSAAPDIVPGGGGHLYSGYVYDRVSGTNFLVGSIPGKGGLTRSVRSLQITRDGRRVVFTTDQSNLTAGDTNVFADVYVQDLSTGSLILASARDGSDESLNGLAADPLISADGRRVLFLSDAQLSGAASSTRKLLLRDLDGRRTHWINDPSRLEVITANLPVNRFIGSADGNTVAFASALFNRLMVFRPEWPKLKLLGVTAVSFALSAEGDHLVYATFSGGNVTLTRLNLTTDESQVLGSIRALAIADLQCSSDGSIAVFAIRDPESGSSFWQIWSVSIGDRRFQLESADGTGSMGNGDSRSPQLSADGRRILFRSLASHLAPGDANGVADIFLRDRYAGTTSLLSQSSQGQLGNQPSTLPQLSGDGRFASFTTYADNLVEGDANGFEDVILASLEDAPPADTDSDGLPDRWELDHLGTLAHSAADDPDLDGQTNVDELAARTSPGKGDSALRLSGAHGADPVPVLEWMGNPGVRYQLEFRSTLTPANGWGPAGDAIPGFLGPIRWSAGDAPSSGFYRLKALP